MRTCSTSSPAGGNSPGSGATGSKVPLVEADAFIVGIEAALNNHDWRTLTAFTEDGGVNYFGHHHASETGKAAGGGIRRCRYSCTMEIIYPYETLKPRCRS